MGAQGLYGFCTSEKQFRPNGPFDAWAYCVLDNDYRPGQFPSLTPLENMQVTAAHEYFHAVQFAYDAFEDSWFMEATATWAEDEIFDDINDNLQYLRRGPLRRPQVPLDKFELGGLHQYGDWIFFRYLTEQFPARRRHACADPADVAEGRRLGRRPRHVLAAGRPRHPGRPGRSRSRDGSPGSPTPTAGRPRPTPRAPTTPIRAPRSAAAAPSSPVRAPAGCPASSTT